MLKLTPILLTAIFLALTFAAFSSYLKSSTKREKVKNFCEAYLFGVCTMLSAVYAYILWR